MTSDPREQHEAHGRELAELLNAVLAGELVTNRAAVERQVVRVLAASIRLWKAHRVDELGRCWFCWTAARGWRRWPKRTACTVHSALSFNLRQPERFVLSVVTKHEAAVGYRS